MVTAICPECQQRIYLSANLKIGIRLNCQACKTALELVWLYPASLDYVEYPRKNQDILDSVADVLPFEE